jgi:hypothetical protein
MDRGRCADVCGGRTDRRLRRVALGHGHQALGNIHVALGSTRAPRAGQRRRRRRIQRPVWSGLRRSSWHGRQRVHVGLHHVDISGSGSDRRRGVRHDVPERDELDTRQRHHQGRIRGAPTTSKQVGQIPANYSEGSGTIVGGTAANKATEAALAAYPGGVVDRVVELSDGEYEVHYIGVNWPHHIFVNQDFTVVGAG